MYKHVFMYIYTYKMYKITYNLNFPEGMLPLSEAKVKHSSVSPCKIIQSYKGKM